jgi:uncharacterized protein YbjT (DUF2867 family)
MTTITVIGATGLIGSKVVELLTRQGHEVVAASRRSGVDVLTGAGVEEAMTGSDVVVDVVNSPSFDDGPVLEFFCTSTSTLTAAGKKAGVGHYVALSIVNADLLPESGYMRAKVLQERVITESGLPYTIVRATQFDEFAESITDSLIIDGKVHAPVALIQPIAAVDVAAEMAKAAAGPAANGIVDIGGPDRMTFAEMATAVLAKKGSELPVVEDPGARYFGSPVDNTSLIPGNGALLAATRFTDWLAAM